MTKPAQLPEYVSRLSFDDTFSFSCHKGVACFTECCRMLELALTPYDALRLRRATGLTSQQLLDDYIIVEQDQGEPFPRFYLTMVDDGRASCVFVSREGCTIYEHRPAACRAYPLGRAIMRQQDGRIEEHFVLMKEQHCQGFSEADIQDAGSYSLDQDLTTYNRFNDGVAVILQHNSIRKGYIPSPTQIDQFILALYNLDTFRELMQNGRLEGILLNNKDKARLDDDEELLLFGIEWLQQQLFEPNTL
ncbi:MAG: YkgJ family cysteine cluster protein [Desulforhopalus sp.]